MELHDPLHGRQACPEFNSFHQGIGHISPREGLFSCHPHEKWGQICDTPAPHPIIERHDMGPHFEDIVCSTKVKKQGGVMCSSSPHAFTISNALGHAALDNQAYAAAPHVHGSVSAHVRPGDALGPLGPHGPDLLHAWELRHPQYRLYQARGRTC